MARLQSLHGGTDEIYFIDIAFRCRVYVGFLAADIGDRQQPSAYL